MENRKIVAKFTCKSVGTEHWGKKYKKDADGSYSRDEQGQYIEDGDSFAESVKLSAVSGPENKPWSEATPQGSLEMSITNPGAQEFIKPGKSYFITISEAPDA